MSCVRLPPSLQLVKSYVTPPTVTGDGAVTCRCEPWITSSVAGAVTVSVPSERSTPAGFDWSVIGTVSGSSRRVTVRLRPKLSVAVSCSSKYDGYSCSGATNEPPAPVSVWITCVWHVLFVRLQCCRLICQLSALAGRACPRKSVPEPEKLSVSPTFQVVPAAGDRIDAV